MPPVKKKQNLYVLVEIQHDAYPTIAQEYLSKIQSKLEAAGYIQETILFNLKRSAMCMYKGVLQ